MALLPHLDTVVTHGGHNPVCESAAHGVRWSYAPITGDQPVIAEQVVAAVPGHIRF